MREWRKQSYSLKHDRPEGSEQCTVMGSRDGMTTHKDSSVMGIEIFSQMQVQYSGQITTGTHALYVHTHIHARTVRLKFPHSE